MKYSVENLLVNDDFIDYVLHKKGETYWVSLAASDPEARKNIGIASEIIASTATFQGKKPEPSDREEVWAKIQARTTKTFRIWPYLGAAAAILLFFVLRTGTEPPYEQLTHTIPSSDFIEVVNSTEEPKLIQLPDRSSVILYPDSKLSYSSRDFDSKLREVYFEGEGFFEVQKDPNRPFLVYANELITKVLGTSFTIKARGKEKAVEVIVKSGKVEVIQANGEIQRLQSPTLGGHLLTENQKISLDRKKLQLSPIVPRGIHEVSHPIQTMNFDFEDELLEDVLADLQKAYPIHISFNKAKWKNTRVTAHLADEPLHEKIELICRAIEAECIQKPNQIEIK
jgi:transmembrane sensor